METSVPNQGVNIYLFKEDISPNQVLRDAAVGYSHAPISARFDFKGEILAKRPSRNPPRWKKFVQSGTDEHLLTQFNLGSSCLVVLVVRKRTFALPFGSARSWINQAHVVRGFGAAVVQSTVSQDRIGKADKEGEGKACVAVFADGKESGAEKNPTVPIAGHPENQDFADRLVGADSLLIDAEISFDQLGEKCRTALEHYLGSVRKVNSGLGVDLSFVDGEHHVSEALIDHLRSDISEKLAQYEVIDRDHGEMLDESEAAARLQIPEDMVFEWIKKKNLLGWTSSDGEMKIPAEQILGPKEVIPHLAQILDIFDDPRRAWMYLSSEWPFEFDVMRPIDKLKGGKFDEVAGSAPSFGTTPT